MRILTWLRNPSPSRSGESSTRRPKIKIMKFQGQTFRDQDLQLDGNEYESCKMENCRLFFGATAPVDLSNNKIDGSTFVFQGAALLTLGFMTKLYADGAVDLIEGLFNN